MDDPDVGDAALGAGRAPDVEQRKTVESDTERGSIQYNNLKITTNIDTTNNSFRMRASITGSMTVDGTTYTYDNDSYDFRYTIDLNP